MILAILGVLAGGRADDPVVRLEIPTDEGSTHYIKATIINGQLKLNALPEPIYFDGGDMMVAMEHVAKAKSNGR